MNVAAVCIPFVALGCLGIGYFLGRRDAFASEFLQRKREIPRPAPCPACGQVGLHLCPKKDSAAKNMRGSYLPPANPWPPPPPQIDCNVLSPHGHPCTKAANHCEAPHFSMFSFETWTVQPMDDGFVDDWTARGPMKPMAPFTEEEMRFIDSVPLPGETQGPRLEQGA